MLNVTKKTVDRFLCSDKTYHDTQKEAMEHEFGIQINALLKKEKNADDFSVCIFLKKNAWQIRDMLTDLLSPVCDKCGVLIPLSTGNTQGLHQCLDCLGRR